MFVHEVMTCSPVTLRADDTARFAAQLLVRREISSAPVVDDGNHVVGMLSEVDLLLAFIRDEPGAGLGPAEADTDGDSFVLHVADVMTARPLTLRPTDDIASAARLLADHGIKAAPVVVAHHPVGVVARRDLLRALVPSDSDVQSDVVAVLADLDLEHPVDVVVVDGVVHLSSAGPLAQHVAGVLARTVPGVLDVQGPMSPVRTP